MAPSGDRERILARRALLVASALAHVAGAQPNEPNAAPNEPNAAPSESDTTPGAAPLATSATPCPPAVTPDDKTLAEAKALRARAAAAYKSEAYGMAREHLQRAYTLTGDPELLAELARVAATQQDWLAARRFLNSHRQCGGSSAAVALAELEKRVGENVGELELTVTPADGKVKIDGVEIKDPTKPILLPVGEHQVEVTWSPQGSGYRGGVIVKPGETAMLEIIGDECATQGLCVPCLSPPPPEQDRNDRFGLAVGASRWFDVVDDGEANSGTGGILEAFYELPLFNPALLRASFIAGLLDTHQGRAVPLGINLELKLENRWPLTSDRRGNTPLLLGVGITSGYLAAKDERDLGVGLQPRSGPLLEPYLTVGVVVTDGLRVGLRSGPVMARFKSATDESFGVGWVSGGLWLSYAFGKGCYEYSPRSCEDDY